MVGCMSLASQHFFFFIFSFLCLGTCCVCLCAYIFACVWVHMQAVCKFMWVSRVNVKNLHLPSTVYCFFGAGSRSQS